jgi:hypothetical protein
MSANSVLFKTASVQLSWNSVATATKYHLQVSSTPDFSASLIVDDATLTNPTKTFTDSGSDNAKRYWRWRYTTDGGTTWQEWSEIGSYWILLAAANEVTLAADEWRLINPDDVTDYYTFDVFPLYSVLNENIYRARERNRLGTLLSEYVTNKAKIALAFSGDNFIFHPQFQAFRRFNESIKTFFLACYISNETDDVQKIWKVQFESDPSITMIAAGRPGVLTGSVSFMEV